MFKNKNIISNLIHKWFGNVMFWIKSKKTAKRFEDHSKFMDGINNINESNNGLKYTVKQAIYIIENIYRLHEEEDFNELIPSWHQALIESLKTLHSVELNDTIQDYIEYGEYLLSHMPLLELHPLKL